MKTPWWFKLEEEKLLTATDSGPGWPDRLMFVGWCDYGWPAWEQQWADAQGLGINARFSR